jgi:hypothetical protein
LYEGRPSFTDRWSDFRFCKWPEHVIRKAVRGIFTVLFLSAAWHTDLFVRDSFSPS